ncbi:holo-ACP synthase [Virgibacillus halophilus]|uniref:Holo-ACP synthase n=2 Tax=Tigheibacillus halophilus TaxID=361280 RepID=A0ABU5C813_9BACI|nr:holo-ACP synthase [Virgibacillus halophilus]
MRSDKRRVEFLAGRFAAKEAFSKAAGTGIGHLGFKDMEVLPNEKGAPRLRVKGFEQYHIFVSLSHSEAYAVAQVVMEARHDSTSSNPLS